MPGSGWVRASSSQLAGTVTVPVATPALLYLWTCVSTVFEKTGWAALGSPGWRLTAGSLPSGQARLGSQRDHLLSGECLGETVRVAACQDQVGMVEEPRRQVPGSVAISVLLQVRAVAGRSWPWTRRQQDAMMMRHSGFSVASPDCRLLPIRS